MTSRHRWECTAVYNPQSVHAMYLQIIIYDTTFLEWRHSRCACWVVKCFQTPTRLLLEYGVWFRQEIVIEEGIVAGRIYEGAVRFRACDTQCYLEASQQDFDIVSSF